MTSRSTEAAADVFVFPTSFAQQRLWFLDQLVPGNAFYNLDSAMRMAMRPTDVPILERTINEIVKRHESLRTTFRAIDGQPVQVVSPELCVSLPVIDLTNLPSSARKAEALRLATEEARQPFDLTTGPLLRTKLLRTGAAEYVFLLTIHHIVADGWSIGVFWSELGAIWQAFERQLPSPLPPLRIQYGDFAVWQHEAFDAGAGESHLEYWKQQLAGISPTQLPTDRPRPDAQSFLGATHVFWIEASQHAKLRRLSQDEGTTLFMTLLAAFQALLCRYTGQEDIVVGAPIANRNRAEVEGLIGFFVNSLVLRGDLSGDPTFRTLLERIREMALDAYAHQDLPFERLVQELQPERDMSRHPLFQVSFQLFTADDEPAKFEDDQLEVTKGTANIDFALDLWEYAEGIYGKIEYSTDLFAAESIDRIAKHYLTLLDGVVQRPDARISELPVLTESERTQVLRDWNDTETAYDVQTLVHGLFEQQVDKSPDAVALSLGEVQVTYKVLHETANRLANYMIASGIGPKDLVGVCLERSLDMIVALLAALKSGAAYVPLDPAYPRERLAFVLADARPKLVLSQAGVDARLPAGFPCLRLGANRHLWEGCDQTNPHCEVSSENLAYVIYTSGSTGSPKGVMVSHRAVCNHLLWAQSALPLGPADRVLHKYSIGFDASVLEIFGTLAAGARLILVPPGEHFDAREFVSLIRREEITVLDTVPSMLRVLLDEQEFAECRSLRRVVCGGEALQLADQEKFFSISDARLYNAYGPTEATIGATLWACRPGEPHGVVPIGRAISNTKIYLLDANMNVVPVGVTGEIYIGGEGLARDYLNRPDLTAKHFVPDPFSGRPGARLYKSGDRARYLADGSLEFVGRVDDQIKLRGIRIEPAEIEACLLRHPSVDTCAVIADESEPTEPQLVAYVVPGNTTPELWPSIGEYLAYDELTYFAMAHDERRNAAYRRAIERLVPGKVVVDVGTGAEAVLARMCAEAGAAHVYAIEVLDDAYSRARDLIHELQLDHAVSVIHGDAMQIELPEKADVCVSELLGTIGSSEGAAVILNDARRFLKPDGVMIPARCVTQIAAVTLPDELAASLQFAELARTYVDRIFERAGGPFNLRICVKGFPRENVISDVRTFEVLEFQRPVPPEFHNIMQLTVRENARFDGFLLWLNVYPEESHVIDVLDGKVNWLPVFFPAFYPGIGVEPGDVIRAECWCSLSDLVFPDYRVAGVVRRADGTELAFDHRSPYQPRVFKNTSFYDAVFSAANAHHGSRGRTAESIEQLNRWREVYDELYQSSYGAPEPAFNPVGWNSTYTGEPIPPHQMREQVADTVQRISRFRPQRVLELGCGTGLILFQLARTCSNYVGTDFSPVALDYVRSQLRAQRLTRVELMERSADNVDGLSDHSFDAVVLNSVVQYFPSVDYLVRVVEQASRITVDGGHIFLGDVRSLPLLEAFYASVELSQCPPSGRPVSEFRERILRRRNEEEELVFAPAFFTALKRTLPQISRVEVQLKRGWHRNELTGFRYDVSLEINGPPDGSPASLWRAWQDVPTLQSIADWVASVNARCEVRGVPNPRVAQHLHALRELAQDGREIFEGTAPLELGQENGPEPEQLWALAAKLGCEVIVAPSSFGSAGHMDVLFRKDGRDRARAIADFGAPEAPAALSSYATDPLYGARARKLVPALNRYLRTVLPEQMVPSAIMLLNALPRTQKGKVDRKALPLPRRLRSPDEESFVGPRNEVEQRLAEIWSDVLKYRVVGVHDNFFTHLGGHSLLATQLISRVRDAFDIELPLRHLFEAPTIAELAVVVEEALINLIEGLSEESVRRLVEDHGG